MQHWILRFLPLALMIAAVAKPLPAAETSSLAFSPEDRILVLAPHPDDEILGAGGVMQRAQAAGAHVKIVFLTYGDNNIWSFTVYKKRPVFFPNAMRAMGEVRRNEAIHAAATIGISSNNLTFLGYPDHGTMDIWCYNWNTAKPFRSELTRVRGVPYKDAYRSGAPYAGESIVADLKKILSDYKPTHVFLTNSADENPDHRALYLFTRVALWELENTIAPNVHPFLVHYHFRRWPTPQGYHPDQPLKFPEALAKDIITSPFPLHPDEIARKYQALLQHKTQFKYSGKYLSSFVRTNELFGNYPLVQLSAGEQAQLDEDEPPASPQLPAEYTPEEKDAFVDLDHRIVKIENNELVIVTTYNRPFKNKFQFDLYAFGYRSDQHFGGMPKIRVIVRKNKYAVFDGRVKLRNSGVSVFYGPNALTVSVPLELLGCPSRVLTGVHTSLEDAPLDVMAWREIFLK